MLVTLVFAMDLDRVIGRDNDLPWRLPADLRHFKQVTMGKPIVMGRRTWESIGRPLPGRDNVVLTRDPEWSAEGVRVFHSVEGVLDAYADRDEIMVIGGAAIYEAFLPHAGRMHMTLVQARVGGDTTFPVFDESGWRETERVDRAADDRNEHACTFRVLERAHGADEPRVG